MNIAITGATGFIGQCLLREHAEAHRFVALTSSADSAQLFQHPNVEYRQIAQRDSVDEVEGLIDSCDAAINLGFARPVSGRADTFSDYLPSIAASAAFFEACHNAGIANIVHVSTRSVYGKDDPLPLRESMAARPFSNYGAAKLAAEAAATAQNEMGRAHVKILRLAQIVGTNERQGVVAASFRAVRAGNPLQLWGTGAETAREYLYVRDATAAIMCALQHPEARGVFNIGTGTMTATKDLLAVICSLFADQGATIEPHPEKHVEAAQFCMDVSKARDILGWEAQWPLPRALEAMRDDVDRLF